MVVGMVFTAITLLLLLRVVAVAVVAVLALLVPLLLIKVGTPLLTIGEVAQYLIMLAVVGPLEQIMQTVTATMLNGVAAVAGREVILALLVEMVAAHYLVARQAVEEAV